MHLVPTEEEVIALLRQTGALREGHFRYPSGLHSNQYLQLPLAMRYYQHQRTLSVGLSRLVRANPEIRAIIPELSIVAPATGGLPVAYGVCEALRAHQVYWAERGNREEPLRFRQFPLKQKPLKNRPPDLQLTAQLPQRHKILIKSRHLTASKMMLSIEQVSKKNLPL